MYWSHIKSFAIRSDCEPLLDCGAGGTPFQSEIWIIYKISWSAVLGIYTTLKLRQRTESAWNHLKSELESEADQPLCLSFAKFPPALSFIGDSQKLYSTSQLSLCRIYLDAFSKLQTFPFTNRSLKSECKVWTKIMKFKFSSGYLLCPCCTSLESRHFPFDLTKTKYEILSQRMTIDKEEILKHDQKRWQSSW